MKKPGRLQLTPIAAAVFFLAQPAWAGSWNSTEEVLNNHPTWIYTPTSSMSSGKRALVIALHGCDQTSTQIKRSHLARLTVPLTPSPLP